MKLLDVLIQEGLALAFGALIGAGWWFFTGDWRHMISGPLGGMFTMTVLLLLDSRYKRRSE